MTLRFAGVYLILAAILFWLSWLMMPGVGITNAAQILELVGRNRLNVAISAGIQLSSCALFAPAMIGLSQFAIAKNARLMLTGMVLLLIGSMGMAADAIFHLLAYEMTHPGTDPIAMLPLMKRMQQTDLLFILPMIAAFFLGAIAISVGAARLRVVPLLNPSLYLVAIAIAGLGAHFAPQLEIDPRLVGLTVLGLVSANLIWVGASFYKLPR